MVDDGLKLTGPYLNSPRSQVIHNADGTATVTDLTVVDISQPLRKSRNFGVAAKGGKKGFGSSSLAASRKGLTTALPVRTQLLVHLLSLHTNHLPPLPPSGPRPCAAGRGNDQALGRLHSAQ